MPTDSLIDTDRTVAAMASELERAREERDALRERIERAVAVAYKNLIPAGKVVAMTAILRGDSDV